MFKRIMDVVLIAVALGAMFEACRSIALLTKTNACMSTKTCKEGK